ncbi:hypothetical protein [Natrinema sp. 1APR25-10V2]|uniref:hypothetical protein n=1 Tax=Natrinema sp. 1APR25-10V2 TaxID=2951081 RepID=UPI002875EEE2|nr:hypothetical protein [Natrinema sp. 1APR25-10V2]MDS0474570.1 hypothetical protein [Natrinema sp. 1APR25-10V2]
MGGDSTAEEGHSLRGPIDRAALLAIREVFNADESLATAELDDYLDPKVLEVTYDDGLCRAETARIDVQWTTQNDYKFHYTDSCGVNLRWGKHPHNNDYVNVHGLEHHHPPPDASVDPSEVEDSCITQSPEKLVTRAVLKLWRVAYHAESLSPLNAGSNPP